MWQTYKYNTHRVVPIFNVSSPTWTSNWLRWLQIIKSIVMMTINIILNDANVENGIRRRPSQTKFSIVVLIKNVKYTCFSSHIHTHNVFYTYIAKLADQFKCTLVSKSIKFQKHVLYLYSLFVLCMRPMANFLSINMLFNAS